MSRGVVLWPDEFTSSTIIDVWKALAAVGLPSMATWTHRLHRPHASLIVAEDLDPAATLSAIGHTPKEPIPLLVEAAGFFPGGVLYLAVVMNTDLWEEQRRVHAATVGLASDPWEYLTPDRWTPHITTCMGLTPDQVGAAMELVVPALPLRGMFSTAGVEDGTTGEAWPSA